MKILKKTGAVALLILTAAAGCSTVPRDFSAHTPMGLVMVLSNQNINWFDERNPSSDGDIADLIRNLLGTESDGTTVRDSRADFIVNEADTILRIFLTEAGVFNLADKEHVILNRDYAAAPQGRTPSNQITAQGYRYINYRDSEFNTRISGAMGLQSLLYVTFEFSKEMISGFGRTGRARVRVAMNTIMVNSAGRVMYRDEIITHSRETMDVSSGFYLEEELMDLFIEAIGEACYYFVRQFQGSQI